MNLRRIFLHPKYPQVKQLKVTGVHTHPDDSTELAQALILRDVKFNVDVEAVQRIRDSGNKEACAWAEGNMTKYYTKKSASLALKKIRNGFGVDSTEFQDLRFNPDQCEAFVCETTGEKVETALAVGMFFDGNGRIIVRALRKVSNETKNSQV